MLGELSAIKSEALLKEGNITDIMSRSDYPFGKPLSTSFTA